MSRKRQPPFRAEHIGSLHRPAKLRQARAQFLGGLGKVGKFGRHDSAELRAVEDECIREVVRLQEDVGLRTITDGEYRRQIWLSEFLGSLGGIELTLQGTSGSATHFRSDERHGKSTTEDVENVRIEFHVNEPIRWTGSVNVDRDFTFPQRRDARRPEGDDTGAAGLLLFRRTGLRVDQGLSRHRRLLGRSRQSLCARDRRAGRSRLHPHPVRRCRECLPVRSRSRRAVETERRRPRATVAQLRRLPEPGVGRKARSAATTSLHICRGNRHGHYMAEGGYDPVADYLFNHLDVDNYYLEYDCAARRARSSRCG